MRALALVLLASALCAAEEQTTLRIGTIAPDGTGWAREVKAMARDVELLSDGKLRLKVYMGGIAGDELEMLERVHRGQLDGILSGGMACESLAPSLRVARIPGLFQTWQETTFVLGRLRATLEGEMRHNGFTYLGEAIVGPSIVFSRRPIATLAQLQHTPAWVWDIDRMLIAALPEMGIVVKPLPIRQALGAYEDGRVDAFISPAVAALGFQWSVAARFFTDVRLGFVVGCLLVSNHAVDALPLASQQALRDAGAKAKLRIEDVGRTQEEQLLRGLLQKQGLTAVRVDESARAAFFEAANAARGRAAPRLVPPALIARVLGLLADFRSEHHAQ